jgi:hypothetical protein
MGSYTILIGLSIAVILSYLFDVIARATKVPSVLMLLSLGSAPCSAAHNGFRGIPSPSEVLPKV